MKRKIISVLMSVLMLFNIAAISPVMAETLLKGDYGVYEFIDTCYSPELGLYVAIAKDFSPAQKNTMKTLVWVSEDMETWEMTKSFASGVHSANRVTRQTIVWWEAKQLFVLYLNNKLYYSSDARSWKADGNANIGGANTSITTNGDKLVMCAKAKIKVCENLEVDPVETYLIDSTPGNQTYGKTIGVTPDGSTYVVGDQWRVWMIDSAGELSHMDTNIGAVPYELVWSDAFEGWITLSDSSVFRIITPELKYKNFSAMVLSDGTTNTAAFTAVETGTDYVAVGTEKGDFYIAPHDASALTVDVQWEIAEPGLGVENTEEIRSITAVDSEKFLAVSDKNIFILEKNDEGLWKYYDVSGADMALEQSRIEIPTEGTFTTTLEPINYNCKGEVSSDQIISFMPMTNQLPEGISSLPISDTVIELSIDSSVTGGHELKYKAMTESGKTKEFTITIVDEDYIEIHGVDEMAIPLEGEEAETYEYSAVIIGTDGLEMSRDVSLEPDSIPEGAEYDSSQNIFKISSEVSDCEIILEAQSPYKSSNSKEKTIKVSRREPRRMDFTSGENSLYIPDSDSKEFVYSVKIYDQIGKEMPKALTVWSLEPVDIASTDAIKIDKDSGILTVGSGAVLGTIKIKAVTDVSSSVNNEMEVTLLYTDKRKALEDLSEFTIDTSVLLTDNIDLKPQRTFGSDVTWRSSDESLIKTDGTVIRPSRENKQVTLTQVVKQNKSSVDKKYVLTVKKADNLCTNGDLADGTANGWQPKGNSALTAVIEDEITALKVDGGGAYQPLTLTNDSSYGFEARVKANSGSGIRLVSEKAGVLASFKANGEYNVIKASYDYRKQKNSFEDKIYVECDETMMIDYLKAYEITLELNEVSAAVNRAVYTKLQSDINTAKTLLNGFYDLPIKNDLVTQVNNITTTPNGGGGAGGGGGGSTSNRYTSPSKTNSGTISNIQTGGASAKDEESDKDKLDTFLLKFKDMKSHWAREDVEYMAELGITAGDESGMYRPDDLITRAELAALVTRAIGLSETPYENSFFDVVSDDWYSGYVQTCRSNDYMNGYDGLFNPHRYITREEIAKVVVSAYNSKSGKQLERGKALYFNDIDSMSYWAYDYIAQAAELGFVNGVTEELFAPKNSATRAEAAVMLRRMYDKLNNAD